MNEKSEDIANMRLTQWLRPDSAVKDASRIDFASLRAQGFNLVLLDLDNTLSIHGSHLPDEFARQVIGKIRQADMEPMLASNALRKRAESFAAELGISFVPGTGKPFPFKIRKAIKAAGFTLEETVLVGDQIFTDVLAARLVPVYAILVKPRFESEAWNVKIKRSLEKPFLRNIKYTE
ncbi:MAG: YqeG family HAD IIIA-type phosphatase [Saccharofermentanales bacterium]